MWLTVRDICVASGSYSNVVTWNASHIDSSSIQLPDSPCGSAYQEALEALKSDYQGFKAGAAAFACGRLRSDYLGGRSPETSASPQALQNGRPSSGSGSDGSHPNQGGASTSYGDSRASSKLAKVLTWPGAFHLYCWASGVVQRCAVQVVTSEPGIGGSTTASAQHWAVLPLASAVPPQLRDAVLRVEAGVMSSRGGGGGAHTSGWLPAGGSSSQQAGLPSSLRVMCTCALPAGTLLSPQLLLLQHKESNVEDLIEAFGPEALTWRRLLQRQRSAVSALLASKEPVGSDTEVLAPAELIEEAAGSKPHEPQPIRLLSCSPPAKEREPSPTNGVTSRRTSSVPSRFARAAAEEAAEAKLQSSTAHPPSVLPSVQGQLFGPCAKDEGPLRYELFFTPPEDDPFYDEKMELLSASGLGTVHFLTSSLDTKVASISINPMT